MKALKIEGMRCTEVDVNDDENDARVLLHSLQDLIGGYVELVRLSDHTALVVDEDGFAKCLPLNPAATIFAEQPILGTAVIIGIDQRADGETVFTDCPDGILKVVHECT